MAPHPDGTAARRLLAIPLVERDAGDVLFRIAAGPVTAALFAGAAAHLAGELPDAPYVFNLCRDRYSFAVAFAASLLRGQVSLLTSDRAPARLCALAELYPGAYALSSESDPAHSVPQHVFVPPPPDCARVMPAVAADQLAAIVFTSGSTGEPAAHRKSWGALAQRSRDAGAAFAFEPRHPASIVGTVPPQHMYGFETTVLWPLHAPVSSWCGAAFYPTDVRHALAALRGPRVLVTTPLQIRAFLRSPVALSGLDRVISATAPLDPALAAEAEARWATRVCEIFGATEVGSIASRRTLDGDDWTAYPHVSLTAAGGGVRVTAPHAEPCTLHDQIELQGATRFRLSGRQADLVKLGGRRASLAGLNRILTGIQGVVDGVFFAPDDLERRSTARLLAYVVAPETSPEDILAALRSQIDPVFLPRRVVRVTALPRNETGKLPHQALLALQAQLGDP